MSRSSYTLFVSEEKFVLNTQRELQSVSRLAVHCTQEEKALEKKKISSSQSRPAGTPTTQPQKNARAPHVRTHTQYTPMHAHCERLYVECLCCTMAGEQLPCAKHFSISCALLPVSMMIWALLNSFMDKLQ